MIKFIWQIIEERADMMPDHVAFISDGREITYKSYSEKVIRIANSFLDIGLKRGDKICTILKPSLAFAEIYAAAASIGLILIPMDQRHTRIEMADHCMRTRPKLLVCDALDGQLREVAKGLASDIDFDRVYTYRGSFDRDDFIPYDVLLDTNPKPIPDIFRPAANDPLVIIFTSGTTGRPKGAVIDHANTFNHAMITIETWGITHNDRAIIYLPMSHVGGVNNQLAVSIYSGQTSIILEAFKPNKILELIDNCKVSRFGAVPTVYRIMLKECDLEEYDLSSVRQIVISGEATSPELIKKIKNGFFEATMLSSWGMSETTGYFTYTKMTDSIETVMDTEGTPGSGLVMKVLRNDGTQAEEMEIGELLVKGKTVISTYMDKKDNENAFQDGWLKTGDLGFLDKDNYLHFVGRSKEMFKSGGYSVYPQEVESYLNALPGVSASCVLGIPDEIWGEVGIAIFVPENNVVLNVEVIEKYCKEGLSPYKRPKKIIIVENLPRNSIGKIQKKTVIENIDKYLLLS